MVKSAEPARGDANEDHDPEQKPINHERPAREVLQYPHQAPDRVLGCQGQLRRASPDQLLAFLGAEIGNIQKTIGKLLAER